MKLSKNIDLIKGLKVLTLSTIKGGVGKSANAVNLAVRLSAFAKVLLIDGDPSGNASANLVPALPILRCEDF